MNVTRSEGASSPHAVAAGSPKAGPDKLLMFAVHAVFGTSFIGCGVLLAGSQLWPGRTVLLHAMGLSVASAWLDVAALGLLWASVSHLLLSSGKRRPGTLCLLGAVLLLVGGRIFTTS